MSLFSKACEYALKSCIFIGQQSLAGNVANVKQISEAIDAPLPFTAKILQQISKGGILQSVRGKQGGFMIDKERLPEITMMDIIKIIDGPGLFVSCGLGLHECSEKNPCPVHEDFKPIREKLAQLVTSHSLHDLATKADLGLAWLKN